MKRLILVALHIAAEGLAKYKCKQRMALTDSAKNKSLTADLQLELTEAWTCRI